MKNYSYIGVSFIILIFGILVIPEIIDRVGTKTVVSENRSDTREERAAALEELSYILIDGEKKRVPDFEFVDQNGDMVSQKDYEGKVYIVEFFFSSCPTICPIMKENLVAVQNEIGDRQDFGIASFSIDASNDTPEVLKAYAERTGVTHPNWHLMTGDAGEVFDLANSGFSIYASEEESAEGGFAHSGYFALVDKEGFIRSRKDRFGNPIVYYRGSVRKGSTIEPGEEEPQTDILIQDVKRLLNNDI